LATCLQSKDLQCVRAGDATALVLGLARPLLQVADLQSVASFPFPDVSAAASDGKLGSYIGNE